MKRLLIAILVAAFALPLTAQVPSITYTANSGVSLFTGVAATATSVSGAVRLPNFSGVGNINITGAGITGSPSGCTIALAYEANNSTTPSAAVSTTSFTPGNNVQIAAISPSYSTGDNYVATYACSSTYPTAGTLTVSFSPSTSTVANGTVTNTPAATLVDPCLNASAAKSSVAVAISTATTTQLVAISGTKAVYVCGFTATFGASTTALFEYGTSTNCTGTNALTGVMAPSTGASVVLRSQGTVMTAPASNGLCLVSTGTGGINGILSYVQM